MKKTELLKLIEALGDDDNVLETLQGIEGLAKSSELDITKLTVEDFKNILEKNEQIKGYNQSNLDSAISKGVESFKTNKMPSYLQEELKKVNNKDKTPEMIALEEMQQKYNAMEKQMQMKELGSKYSKVLSEKGLPLDLVDYILSDGNEESINSNIEKFSNMFSTVTNSKVNEKLNNNSYVPPKDNGTKALSGVEQAFYAKNPTLQ